MNSNAILVVGTPNDEMLPDHGFSYGEIDSLFGSLFDNYLIIENSLLPPPKGCICGKKGFPPVILACVFVKT